MKHLIILALCVAVTQAYNVRDGNLHKLTDVQTGGRIYYGMDAKNGQFPHQVFFPWPIICGGSIISDKWVVSAAHCFTIPFNATIVALPVTAHLGDVHWRLSPVVQNLYNLIIHPLWDWKNDNYDIALLELEKSLTFTANIKPIRIPSSRDEQFDGELAILSGFGHKQGFVLPEILQYAYQRVQSDAECKKLMGPFWAENVMCTVGYPSHINSVCMGDSGGPLTITRPEGDFLIGIVCSGFCDGSSPAGYVRPHFLLDWIRNTTGLDI